MHVCLCVSMCTWLKCFQRPEEGVGSPRAGVTCMCELPNMGAGNWTQIYKSSKCSNC